jgi:tight adherence protein B
MIIPTFVFALMISIILGAYWVFIVRPEEQENRALRNRLKGRRASVLGPTIVKARESLSSLAPLNAVLARFHSSVEPLQRLVNQSGVRTTVGATILAMLLMFTITFTLIANLASSVLLSLAVGTIVGAAPFLYLRRRVAKRLALFEEQFPESMDLIARALRAGHALPTALQLVGEEIPNPVGGEFKLLFEQQNYGMSLNDALKAMAERVPLLDARFFVTALLTQREMGGNLSEVLNNLASVIRERFKVKRQVKALSAHGRITGIVLASLPPALAGIMFIISPTQIRLLFEDPLGVEMVVLAIVLQCTGLLIIRRIVNVEY